MEARSPTLPTVLIVEDNPDGAETTAAVLRLRGYEVWVALSPAEALRVAAECRPQAVVTDIGLPGMNGYELAHRMCEVLGNKPMLVAVTGYGHLEEQSRTEGFDHHFLKPVDPNELARALAAGTGRPAGSPVPAD